LLTGAFEPVDQARAAEAGCDGVLAKPFEPQLVIGRVRELLTKRKGPLVADLAAPADADDEWALPNLDAATRREATPDGAPPTARQQEPVASVPMVEAVAPLPDSVERPAARSPVEELRPESQHDDSLHVEPDVVPSRRIELPRKPVELPPLSDAFAALLAAEQ